MLLLLWYHGGLTAAARVASGKDVQVYYGDTREPEHVEMRTLADEVRRVVRTKLLKPQVDRGTEAPRLQRSR